jgi:uncharacterized membrane protein
MPKTTLAGHPLHPQLIVVPAGLMPLSLVLDLLHLKTGKSSYAEAATYAMTGGVVGGALAGASGLGDYLEISPYSETKRLANIHLVLNLGMMALYGVNLLMRRGKKPPSGPVPAVLNLIGNIGLLVSAWYGGHMVYDHGMRVKGLSEVAGAPELRLPGDEKLEESLAALPERVSA